MAEDALRLSRFLDRDWMRNALLAQSYNQSQLDKRASLHTDADVDFTDTQIGGSLCINPLPQFTRSADVRRVGLGGRQVGLGRYYYEAIKSNWQVINVRLGVQTFTPLTTFITNFYNSEAAILARTGSAPSLFYSAGRIGGAVVSLMSWQIQAARMIAEGFSFFMTKGTTKFYTLKPAMPLYWNAVQTMSNQIAVYRGIVPRVFGEEPKTNVPTGYQFNQEDIKTMVEAMPLLFHRSGTIDILAVAQRAQRMARRQIQRTINLAENSEGLREVLNSLQGGGKISDPNRHPNLHTTYIDQWLGTRSGGAGMTKETVDDTVVSDVPGLQQDDSLKDFMKAEFDEGAAFVGLRVTPTSGITDQFSNTVGESELASTLNNIASSGRNLRFSFAGGKIAPVIDSAVNAVSQFVQGALDSFGIGGVAAALTGGAFTDVPSTWRGSDVQLAGASYTIPLVTPYNHAFAQYLFMDIPLCMILAMVMPLSSGKQSYQSPFICEIYDKGRTQSRLAIVDQVVVTRGVNSLAFNRNSQAMGYEVQISFKYLDNLMHMPIVMGISLTETIARTITTGAFGAISAFADGVFDDDNLYTDYLATLSSLGLADQIYNTRKLKLNLTRQIVKFDSMTSMTRLMSFFADSTIGNIIQLGFPGTIRD